MLDEAARWSVVFLLTVLATPGSIAQEVPTERHAIVIGVDYDRDSALALPWSSHDAVRVYNALVRDAKFPRRNVTLLTHATRDLVASAIRRLERDVSRSALLVFYYSGHGLRLEKAGAHLSMSDTDLNDEESIRRSALPIAELSAAVRRTSFKHTLFVFDACRTAVNPAETEEDAAKDWSSLVEGLASEKLNAAGATRNVRVWYSCRLGQRSHASDEIEGSAFTHYLVEGLSGLASAHAVRGDLTSRGSEVTTANLMAFARRQVVQWAKKHGHTKQEPADETAHGATVRLAGVPMPSIPPTWVAALEFLEHRAQKFSALEGSQVHGLYHRCTKAFPGALCTMLRKGRRKEPTACFALLAIEGDRAAAIARQRAIADAMGTIPGWRRSDENDAIAFVQNDGPHRLCFEVKPRKGNNQWIRKALSRRDKAAGYIVKLVFGP